MPPTTRSVARLRLRAEKFFLTQTCTIQEATMGTGVTQGPPTWTTQNSDVPCRLILQRQFARNEVLDLAGLEVVGEVYVLVLPQKYSLRSNTRVLLEGLYYDVILTKQHLSDKTFNLYVVTRQEGI